MASFNDHITKFKQLFGQQPVVRQEKEISEENYRYDDTDSVDLCCGWKFCKTCYPETNEGALKREKCKKKKIIKQKEIETDILHVQVALFYKFYIEIFFREQKNCLCDNRERNLKLKINLNISIAKLQLLILQIDESRLRIHDNFAGFSGQKCVVRRFKVRKRNSVRYCHL